MGRACNSHRSPSVEMAHSMSTGTARSDATRRTSSLIRSTSASSSTSCGPRNRRWLPSASSRQSSGVASPETRASPRPATALTIVTSSPVIGSAEKATPAARASTWRWTRTAMPALGRRRGRSRTSGHGRTRRSPRPRRSQLGRLRRRRVDAQHRRVLTGERRVGEILGRRPRNAQRPRRPATERPIRACVGSVRVCAPTGTTTPGGTACPSRTRRARVAALVPTTFASSATSSSRRDGCRVSDVGVVAHRSRSFRLL